MSDDKPLRVYAPSTLNFNDLWLNGLVLRQPKLTPVMFRMALRKGKIVEAAGVQRRGGAGEKEEVLSIAFGYLEILLCTPAPCSSAILMLHTLQLNLVPFSHVPFISHPKEVAKVIEAATTAL
ncbi:hypothetical protein LC609_23060 [Nostoc sp. XA013]|nr:hypothetical protein [Nostoc sp. XA013]